MPTPLLSPGEPFPPGTRANRDGLVAVTTDLSADRLAEAYSMGIFPWFERRGHFFWFCPHPRMVLLPDALRFSRSLRKTLSRGTFEIRADTAFREVIGRCASVPRADGSTWISPAFRRAYGELHDRGLAHSVEAWREGRLAGGLYGVSLGAAFMGESMFSLEPNASKVAFATLVEHLREWGFHLVDCQVHTTHLERFGAIEIPRSRFLAMLRDAVREPAAAGPWRIPGPSPIVSRRVSTEEGRAE